MKLEDLKNKYICVGAYRRGSSFWDVLKPENPYISIYKTLKSARQKAKEYWDDMCSCVYYVNNDLDIYECHRDKTMELLYKAYKECFVSADGLNHTFVSYSGKFIGETYSNFLKPKEDFTIKKFIFKKDNLYPWRKYMDFVYETGTPKYKFLLTPCNENCVTSITCTTKNGVKQTFNNFIYYKDILDSGIEADSRYISYELINFKKRK